MGYLNAQLENGEDLDQLDGYSSILNGITPAALKETAVKYLSGDNYIRLELLPAKMIVFSCDVIPTERVFTLSTDSLIDPAAVYRSGGHEGPVARPAPRISPPRASIE